MDLQTLKLLVEIVSGIAALVAGLVAGFWAYSKYVLERSLLPPVQFETICSPVGRQKGRTVLEIQLHLKNLGSSALVATDIKLDVLYLDEADEPILFNDPQKPTFARLRFPRSLRKELAPASNDSASGHRASASMGESPERRHDRDNRGIPLLQYDTFVQPGVDQLYTLVTTVPASTSLVLVWSSFRYAQHPSLFQRALLFLSRRLGLLQYSLTHVREPHTIERVFRVAVSAEGSQSEAADVPSIEGERPNNEMQRTRPAQATEPRR